jgi:hypothetical protein
MFSGRTHAVAAFFVIGVLFCLGQAKAQTRRSFPGERSTSKSPNGRYVLHNIDDDTSEPSHQLILEDLSKHTSSKLISYNRSVDVLWSPGGSKLIVNDHGGSDFTEAYVFILGESLRKIDLTDELNRKYSGSARIFKNHHVYLEGISWLDEKRIKIKVFGYGEADPDGFVKFFEYTIAGVIKRVSS